MKTTSIWSSGALRLADGRKPSELGSADAPFISRSAKLAYRIETREDRVPTRL